MAAHSKIGASSFYRWSACPGSVKLSEGIPSKPSEYAQEGTLAHAHAEYRLANDKWADEIDLEMKAALEIYVDYVLETAKGRTLKIEQKFDLTTIHPGMFGTSDAVVYDYNLKKLWVIDLKYGQGIPVDVKDNGQLKYYALGAMLSLGYPCNTIEIVIVQPRAFHAEGPIRSQELNFTDLLDFSADLKEYAVKTEEANAPLNSGDHCRFCPAAHLCPKLQEEALEVAKVDFSSGVYAPEKLAEVLAKLPTLEAFIKNVKEFAHREAMEGKPIPGFKLVEGRTAQKWIDDSEVENFLLIQHGLDYTQVYEKKIKSPSAIKKMLKKGDKDMVDHLISKVRGSLSLVPMSDKRPAAKVDAITDFTEVKE
jgi:hypothetical protein